MDAPGQPSGQPLPGSWYRRGPGAFSAQSRLSTRSGLSSSPIELRRKGPAYVPGPCASLFEEQRLDDDRHHIGGLDHAADVDIVELLELHAVDRDHIGAGRDLGADEAAEAHA